MLNWDEDIRKGPSGRVVRECYRAQIPHWGEACVHTHIHHPGEMFLECHALGIEMHPLGQVEELDALEPAETVLLRTLGQYGIWCFEAMTAISCLEK